ncbi:MAG: type II toxin-antitoxin system VapC family toxin [Actinomycetes bacterium]
MTPASSRPALADDGDAGDLARARLHGQALAATDLADLPLERARHAPLPARCWELRQHLTPYDAAYVALAEALDVELLTVDARLAAAPGLRCAVSVLS